MRKSFLEINTEFGIAHFFDSSRKIQGLGTIGLHHARTIARNLKAGVPYYCASPVYALSRTETALFHVHMDELLATRR